jgi:hypothetical protein
MATHISSTVPQSSEGCDEGNCGVDEGLYGNSDLSAHGCAIDNLADGKFVLVWSMACGDTRVEMSKAA